VEQTRADPADQIEEEIREVAERILDVVAKDPEEEHVSAQVKPVAVEKHAGNQGRKATSKPTCPARNAGIRAGTVE